MPSYAGTRRVSATHGPWSSPRDGSSVPRRRATSAAGDRNRERLGRKRIRPERSGPRFRRARPGTDASGLLEVRVDVLQVLLLQPALTRLWAERLALDPRPLLLGLDPEPRWARLGAALGVFLDPLALPGRHAAGEDEGVVADGRGGR